MTSLSTKETILINAYELFAKKGFHGLGVREIAQVADVNIGAINYHFQSKENLYIQSLHHSYQESARLISEWAQLFIDKTTQDSQDMSVIEDFCLYLFSKFIEHETELRTHFKLYLEGSDIQSSVQEMSPHEDMMIGPPGSNAIKKLMLKVNSNLKNSDIEWFIRCIFSQVVHKAIVISCYKNQPKHGCAMDQELFYEDLTRLTRSLFNTFN